MSRRSYKVTAITSGIVSGILATASVLTVGELARDLRTFAILAAISGASCVVILSLDVAVARTITQHRSILAKTVARALADELLREERVEPAPVIPLRAVEGSRPTGTGPVVI